jgi:cytochrome c peroxidase
MSQHRVPLVVLALHVLALGACLALSACGGAAGAATNDTAGAGGGAPTPVVNPPTPGDPALDATLAPLLARADARPLLPLVPESGALVALGRALFFDKVLSGNRNISCATCHHPAAATGDALSVSIGEGGFGTGAARQLGAGTLIPRNAPPLFSLGARGADALFWDGRVRIDPATRVLQTPEPALNGPRPAAAALAAELTTALAAQACFPVTSDAEMRGQPGDNEIADAADNLEVWRRLMARLVGTAGGTVGGIPEYRALFAAAYPGVGSFDDLTFGHAARAIAAYEAFTFTGADTPYDRYLQGETAALTDTEKRGAILFFGRAGCARCHGGPQLSDFRFHGVAVPQVGPGKDFAFEDTGRALVTGNPADRYQFRTPPLRGVALSGPWMHDGAYTSLAEVVRHYIDPVRSLFAYDATQLAPLLRPTVDRDAGRNQARANALAVQLVGGVRLSPADVDDLVAFLGALTDPASRDLLSEVPLSVPSGLPVAD